MRTFEDFKLAYPMPYEEMTREWFEKLSEQEREDAILFIPYGQSFFAGRQTRMIDAATWVLGWWHGIPPILKRKERERIARLNSVDAPPMVPADQVQQVLRHTFQPMSAAVKSKSVEGVE